MTAKYPEAPKLRQYQGMTPEQQKFLNQLQKEIEDLRSRVQALEDA